MVRGYNEMNQTEDDGLRNFHQAKWDEPIIYELSTPGERGVEVPSVSEEIEDQVGDGVSDIPDNMRREARRISLK